jgi:hypothetical protein
MDCGIGPREKPENPQKNKRKVKVPYFRFPEEHPGLKYGYKRCIFILSGSELIVILRPWLLEKNNEFFWGNWKIMT